MPKVLQPLEIKVMQVLKVIIKLVRAKSVATSRNETDFTQGFELAILCSVTLPGLYLRPWQVHWENQ